MTIRCPQCSSVAPLSDADIGSAGRMVRCDRCGTSWLARLFDEDPYQRPALRLATHEPTDVSDAVVIEHIGPGFAKLPPRHRVNRAARKVQVSGSGWKTLCIILGALVAIVVLRAPIVAALPELSGMKGLSGEMDLLEFQKVRSETVHLNGVSTLFVEGEIANRSGADVALPAIRITLKSPAGAAVTSWLVEPSAAGLAAGRSIGFRSALASPPEGATQVTLDLAARDVKTVGLR